MRTTIFSSFLLFSISIVSYSQSVTPVALADGKYGFTFKNLYFEVDAQMGGRIRSFKIDSEDVIFSDWENNSLLSGSTFWPSPQENWGWPPSTALDSDPYTSQITNNKLVLVGDADSESGLYFEKIFSASESDSSISIEYIIHNSNSSSQTWAPWEVTRVPQNGLTFFGKGNGDVWGDMAGSSSESLNCVWYDQSVDPDGAKFFCDGKGWIAHVNTNKQFFIKVFNDIDEDKAAPGEAEIEVYTNPGLKYTELENQGAYSEIPAYGSYSWIVKWYLRNLPISIDASNSNQALVDYANGFVKRLPVSINNMSSGFNVYPNPANNYIMLPEKQQVTNSNILIYNILGKLVLHSNIQSNRLDISQLSPGFYVLEINTKGSPSAKSSFLISR